MPTSTNVRPIRVTTTPVTSGVITLDAKPIKGPMRMGMIAATRHVPKTTPRAFSGDLPLAMTVWANPITGAKKTKLVP